MKKLVVLTVLALVCGLVAASSAVADDTICDSVLRGGTHEEILVPSEATCLVIGATVTANIKALEGARLGVADSTVGGNIDGDKAELVQVKNSTVGGNITIKEGKTPEPNTADVFVCGVTLTNGNILVERMTGGVYIAPLPLDATPRDNPDDCDENVLLNGNIQVQENVITPGTGLVINLNSVSGNVQALKNVSSQPGQGVLSGRITVGFNTRAQNVQVSENTGFFSMRVINNMVRNVQVFKNATDELTIADNLVKDTIQCEENSGFMHSGENMAAKAEGQCSSRSSE